MLFSSSVFLFAYLPIVLVVYYIPLRGLRRAQNLFLLAASLLFYAWGEPWFVLVMAASIAANYGFGLWVHARLCRCRSVRLPVAAAAVCNLGLLFVFKYLTFTLTNLGRLGLSVPVPVIGLPIGISFFTFQAMSYVFDVARGETRVQRSLADLGLYISFFPQLIAGPIVKYSTIAEEILHRRENWADFSAGCCRFVVGLGKKVLLANQLASIADAAWGTVGVGLSMPFAWLGSLCYTLQIYFDFSGYSDMAIGLGRMFGFHFLENFRFPFIAKSVAGFWKRWHISMTSWFQDYLYIPLGGSRVKTPRLLFNMFMVWFCTGLWHGAAWTYVLWGIGFFVMLVIERFTGLGKWMEKHPIGHLYAMLMVVFFTVMIRCDNLPHAWTMYGSLLGVNGAALWNSVTSVLCREYGWFFLAALICGLPVRDFIVGKLRVNENLVRIAGAVALVMLFGISVSYIAVNGYNPFIYFNF